MLMILHVPGAPQHQLDHGVTVAQAVLNRARVTAAEAAMAHWAWQKWQGSCSSGARPPAGVVQAAAVFTQAERAAIDVCCKGTPPPEGSHLEVAAS
jgi:hypothetical protein